MKLEACISDADVLIKLCKAGVVHILPKVFTMVKVPQVVLNEVERKTPPERYHALKRCEGDWLEILTPDIFDANQRRLFEIFLSQHQYTLDTGERYAAAFANELSISIILSDDKAARRIIETLGVTVLSMPEILWLNIQLKELTLEEGQVVFDMLNEVVDHPITTPFARLLEMAEKRLAPIFGETKALKINR
jgi:predicted nucleic acid-binding protein